VPGPFASTKVASRRWFALLFLLVGECAFAQTATVPGSITAPFPTLHSITLEWSIAGDSDLDGVVTVRYREAGAGQFRQGMNLRRVPAGSNEGFSWGNRHSGSIFDLIPGTDYEVELTLADPDGGGAQQVVAVATRPVPAAMVGAPVRNVTPANLNSMIAAAQPGDVLLFGSGVYPGFTFARDGADGAPIVLRGLPGAQINGELGLFSRNFVHVESLTINGRLRFNGSDNVAVTRCTLNTSSDGIVTFLRSENAYIADNVVLGATTWQESSYGVNGNNVGEGILVTGPGHSIINNRVSGMRDTISFLEGGEAVDQFSIDVIGNDLSEAGDDGIEADFCFHNCRIMRNRLTNTFIAFSSQPSLGGPTYFVRNVAYNVVHVPFKLYRSSIGDVLLHNTIVKQGDAFGAFPGTPIARLLARNNLFLGGPGGTYAGFSSGTGRAMDLQTLVVANADLNFDAFGSTTGAFTGRFGPTSFNTLAQMRATTTELAGQQVTLAVFAQPVAYPADANTQFAPVDLRPAQNGGAGDIGVAIANINDGFAGSAPDAGAYEVGSPLPPYGPRPLSPPLFADGFE
jgi:hypothetical protein